MTTLFDIADIQARIYTLPDRPPFMLSNDLAEVYGTTTRKLNQAVKRNPARFPERYAFRLSKAEEQQRWSQFVTTSAGKRTDLEPLVFTHGGANMLASVLRGPVADEMAVAINDAFTEMEQGAIADAKHMVGKLRTDILAHMVGKLRTDILAKKPIYVRIKDASERGVHIDTLWRETNYPKHKLEAATREMVKLGMIAEPLAGMQRELF